MKTLIVNHALPSNKSKQETKKYWFGRLFLFKTLLLIQFTLLTINLNAQLCDLTYTNTSAQAPSQPSNCHNFLTDFVTNPTTDNVIEVKLLFWVFAPATNFNAGAWTKPGHVTTLADAQSLVTEANNVLSNLQPPQLTLPGVPTTTNNAKIQFVASLQYVNDDDDYYSFLRDSVRSWKYFPYYEENYINIYLGGGLNQSIHSGNNDAFFKFGTEKYPAIFPFNYVIFQPQLNYFYPYNPDWDNLSIYGNIYAETLVHEVGHVLGLYHSTGPHMGTQLPMPGEPYSSISPTFGCCSFISSNDYVRETHVAHESCGTIGGSNNIMSQNSACYKYLSPQQIAVMHYNLRTSMISVLSPSGYNAATNVNHAFDYNVTSNETWTSDRYFKGDITVKAGKMLTINCGVAMTAGAKILVEKTAVLVVNGGKITNISGRTWDGIYVWGDPTKSQALNPSNTNFAQFQGWVKLYNATISHAKIGVRNHNNPWSENGGIITAYNTNFINNYMDVEQIGPSSTPSGLASASRFYNCNFETTDFIGDNQLPYTHAYLYRSVGAAFYGCNFEYAAGTTYNNPGYGIYSINSKFTADKNGAAPNVFRDLDRGVYVNNWNPLNVPTISNSQFINNLSYGAYFMNANTLVFQKNLVQNPGALTAFSGLYLNNCKYYTIKNNAFTEDLNNKAGVALSIYNSTGGAHQVYRNSFSKSWIAINAMGNNSGLSNNTDGLKMNCNDFTPTANLYDIALDLGNANVAPSVMTKQGETNLPQMSSTNLVRNMYAATCVNNNENKWYIHTSSSKAINHGCNNTSTNGASTKPSPQPSCSRSIVNIITNNIILDYPAHCLGTTPSSGGTGTTQTQRLSNMNSYLVDLKADNTDGKNNFEIEATVASKINLFIEDSLNNGQDSVIALLSSNQGNMPDADIQTVFAYMAKGDYSMAQTKVSELQNRADWATLLTKLILVDQYAGGMSDLTIADRRFFETYANTEGKDGQSIAQAVLKAGDFNNYNEPHNYPEGTSTSRFMAPQADPGKKETDKGLESLLIYPNPTKTGITLYYNSESESDFQLEIRDLLGRLIYTNFITGKLIKQYIPLDQFNKGMYLITISRNNEIINKTKVIKED